MNNGAAHQAMSCITPELVRQTLLDLIDIRSPTGHEAGMALHGNAGFRRRFARIAAQREAELRAALERSQVDALELATDDDLVDAIVRFVDVRKRRSQLAAGGLPAHLRRAAA